jgi:hypothetical protein
MHKAKQKAAKELPSQRTTIEKGGQTHNWRLAKKRVQWLIEHFTSYKLLYWVDSLVLRNPLLC